MTVYTMVGLPGEIQKQITINGITTCWHWMGSRSEGGYGSTSWAGRTMGAHRVVYEFLVGQIPDGWHLDHRCWTPPCVNPAHLEPVSPQENQERKHRARGQAGYGPPTGVPDDQQAPEPAATGPQRCDGPDCDAVLHGRDDQRFCSGKCRTAAHRARRHAQIETPEHLANIRRVIGSDDRTRTQVVLARLMELDPDVYESWSSLTLAATLRYADIPIVKTHGGIKTIRRDDVERAAASGESDGLW